MNPVVIIVRLFVKIMDIGMRGEQEDSARGQFADLALILKAASGLDEKQEVIVKAIGTADVHGALVHGIVSAYVYCNHGGSFSL